MSSAVESLGNGFSQQLEQEQDEQMEEEGFSKSPLEPEDGSTRQVSPSLSSSLSEGGSGSTSHPNTPTPDPSQMTDNQNNRQINTKMQYLLEEYVPPSSVSSHDLSHSYCWDSQLTSDPSFLAAPVSAFKHAPMSDGWDNIIVGMKVEVENSDAEPIPGVFSTAFWVATVLRISGYKVLLRYEGFGQDGSKDFWINLCSEKVHPVGWCATKGKPLIPPKTIQAKYTDWKEFLVKRLTGARTLPTNFYKVVWESVGSLFKKGMKLEVVDKMRISQVRVATIVDITGRRLQLHYDDNEVNENADGFWCHEESPLIHPVGWARRVGHQIAASQAYHDRCVMESYLETDTQPEMFPEYRMPPANFKAGMKIEAVDPLNLATICVATVMKVLRHGYIMIRMDGYETDPTGGDWFCYHGSSPFVFPPGFCERNNIKLKVPAGYEGDFLWVDYLKTTKSEAAPMLLFSHKDDCKHIFKVGMKVECTDLMDPRLVCVGTISRVVNRLLKVHFDGWEDDYDQWMDCESVDVYPVGWCELVGHRLEGPRMKLPLKKEPGKKEKKRKAVSGTPAPKKPGGGNKARKKGSNVLLEPEPEDPVMETVSRSPTPPPVLEPEVQVPPPNLPALIPMEVQEDAHETQETIIGPSDETLTTEGVLEESIAATEPELKDELAPEEDFPSTSEGQLLTQPEGFSNPASTQICLSSGLQTSKPTLAVAPTQTPVADTEPKYIPRLLDAAGNVTPRSRDQCLEPLGWTVKNLTCFLETNECSNLTYNFQLKEIDGAKFLSLSKQEIMGLVNNKMGPCLKVEHLQKLLKDRLTPAQARLLSTTKKNG